MAWERLEKPYLVDKLIEHLPSCSYSTNQVFNVPIGGKIPDMDQVFTVEQSLQLSKELAATAVRYTG